MTPCTITYRHPRGWRYHDDDWTGQQEPEAREALRYAPDDWQPLLRHLGELRVRFPKWDFDVRFDHDRHWHVAVYNWSKRGYKVFALRRRCLRDAVRSVVAQRRKERGR